MAGAYEVDLVQSACGGSLQSGRRFRVWQEPGLSRREGVFIRNYFYKEIL
jgi:hypothetical protein